MKLLSAYKIRQLDQLTIEKEPISSLDLMERAARTFVHWFTDLFPDDATQVRVICGTGNNGGDGLAIARLLHQKFYEVEVFLCQLGELSPDAKTNLERLKEIEVIPIHTIHTGQSLDLPPSPQGVLIDGLFGSGLNRPVEGFWKALIQRMNALPLTRVSIDIPSGLFTDKATQGTCVQADYTFSFEMPKLAFLMPENVEHCGHWVYRSIGLHPESWEAMESPWRYVEKQMAQGWLRPRRKFDHKGDYGHALLVMGSLGKMGAAILAARACLRSGTGLVTIHAPQCGYQILQSSVPEAMVICDHHMSCVTEIDPSEVDQDAIGIGCGIGVNRLTALGMKDLLARVDKPLVLDADALNILAQHPAWWELVPKESILTPHPGEFRRLFGDSTDGFARLELLGEKATEHGVYILLKGAHTVTACPDGTFYFNSTGNPGMATGGSGDVLTGIITGLLAQGYSPQQATILGVYLHGLAGDIAAAELCGQEALLASDIVAYLGKAFQSLK